MGAVFKFDEGESRMASRWRKRRMCVLLAEQPVPTVPRDMTARGAFLETNARPPIGSRVELHHPEAGAISGTVNAIAADGIVILFDPGERAVAFALAAIAADMSRPAVQAIS